MFAAICRVLSQADTTSTPDALYREGLNKRVEKENAVKKRFIAPIEGVYLSLGLDKDFITNSNFNSWTASRFNTTINPNIFGAAGDIEIIRRNYTAGLNITNNCPYMFTGFFMEEASSRNPDSEPL